MIENYWYHAEYARSNRATCKEFRCKRKIEKGELRIGKKQDENDHMGADLGWYCFEDAQGPCLWKTFTYKKNANKPIAYVSDISGFAELREVDQARIEAILAKKAATKAPNKRAAD